ncbi:MAG: ureidoglycolate lyase [Oceanicoccus sp.]|jgi:ureidoglycolate lyase
MTNVIHLTPEPLSQDAFAVFGDVIHIDDADTSLKPIMINEGTTERFHKLATVELNGQGSEDKKAQAIMSIFRAQPRTLPMNIAMMERHPLGSQAFLPSNDTPYLVLVCEGKDAPEPETLKLFVAKGQGVNYHANTWHHPLLALDHVNVFWVVDRSGSGNNLEEKHFSSDCEIEIKAEAVNAIIKEMA